MMIVVIIYAVLLLILIAAADADYAVLPWPHHDALQEIARHCMLNAICYHDRW